MRLYNDYLNKMNERALVEIGEVEREDLREKMVFADQIEEMSSSNIRIKSCKDGFLCHT